MSIREWWQRVTAPTEGTEHAALGTPSLDLDEAPPSLDQEANVAVSGGGMVGRRTAPRHKATRSR